MAFIYSFTDLWNAGGTTFDAIKVDVTDTASAAASLLLNLSVGGSVKFSVGKGGQALGTSFTLVTGTAAESAVLGNRVGVTFPVPYFTPLTNTTVLAFDIFPKGAPGNRSTGGGLGPSWMDICSTDIIADGTNFECMRLSQLVGSYGHVSMAQGGTGTVRNLSLQTYGGNVGIKTTTPNYSGWSSTVPVLTVAGAGAPGGVIELGSTAADASGTLLGNLEWVMPNNSNAARREAAGLFGYTAGATANDRGGELRVATKPDGATQLTFRYVFDNTGNLRSNSAGYYGWTSTGDPTGTIDTTVSRNAAGVTQFGTTAANAAGSWLAANGAIATGTITTSQPFAITQTWNAGGVTFNAALVNVTNTASASGSTLLDLQVGGVSKVAFINRGALLVQGSNGTFPGIYLALQGDANSKIGVQLDASNLPGLFMGLGGASQPDTTLSRNASGVFQFGTTAANALGSWLATNGTLSGTLLVSGRITTLGGAVFIVTNTALTDGVGASAGTITNAPSIGNPTKWIGINDNGTTRYIPAW